MKKGGYILIKLSMNAKFIRMEILQEIEYDIIHLRSLLFPCITFFYFTLLSEFAYILNDIIRNIYNTSYLIIRSYTVKKSSL